MISFQNAGLIDIRAVITFGASSKETANPIGFFGTGLKYAIAILLREQHEVELYRGLDRYRFFVQPTRIRVHDFDVVCMEGPDGTKELGFTTELGKQWQLWQAFRELYCNAKDEGGTCDRGLAKPSADTTTVRVKGEAFDAVYFDRYNIFLESKPAVVGELAEIHASRGDYIFYRGIRVSRLKDTPGLYRYNILRKITLTEDRTVAEPYQITNAIMGTVLQCEEESIVRDVLFAPQGTFEHGLSWNNNWTAPGPVFTRQVIEGAGKPGISQQALEYVRRFTKKTATPMKEIPLPAELAAIEVGRKLCALIGYDTAAYTVSVTTDLPDTTLGVAVRDTSEIFLNRRVFQQGQRMVTGTLFEEYLHLKFGFNDESRQMQNFLLDVLVTQAELAIAEHNAEFQEINV